MVTDDLQLDPKEVRRLLDELSDRLTRAGVAAQVHIIGGSAMALLFPDDVETRVTQDIDALFSPATEVRRVVESMAAELGLSPHWLNSNGAPFVPPREAQKYDDRTVAITIASVEDLIAMKLAASREQDLHDLGILARHAGIISAEELVEIAFRAYGDDSVILSFEREDYLIMARQALASARKRRTRAAGD